MGLEEGVASRQCRLQARACAEAAALDASIPRPGLTSVTRPRPGHDVLGFVGLTGLAYEACLCSCMAGLLYRRGWSQCWLRAVEEMATRWGNTGLGLLWLLSLQSHALGIATRNDRGDRDEAVMGASRVSVELEGVEGALAFYAGLAAASPGYLARISWSGLPDASDASIAAAGIVEGGIDLLALAEEASLYDPVMADTARLLGLSVGYLVPAMAEWADEAGLVEAMRRATLHAVAVFGDMLVRRKLGMWLEEAAAEAESSPVAEALLWRFLRSAGPGSVADLVAAAAARLLYLAWLGVVELHGYQYQ